jgi:hypothetical protein
MADVVLSYAHEDTVLAHRLARILEAVGWTLWWDRRLTAGSDLHQTISSELDNARCVVVLWSCHSVESHWVRDEAQSALDRGVLVPVTLDGTRPPMGFRTISALDASRWEGSAHGELIETLLLSIANKVGPLNVEERLARRSQPKHSMFYDEPPTREVIYGERIVLFDIADDIATKIKRIAEDPAPERTVLALAERLFRRPAFYPHTERNWHLALYAIVKTRIVWEQEVVPRLRVSRRPAAADVTQLLLQLEDQYAKVLDMQPEELSQVTAAYLHDKSAFMNSLPRKPIRFEMMRAEAETKRAAVLKEMSALLEACGVYVPEVGTWCRAYGKE